MFGASPRGTGSFPKALLLLLLVLASGDELFLNHAQASVAPSLPVSSSSHSIGLPVFGQTASRPIRRRKRRSWYDDIPVWAYVLAGSLVIMAIAGIVHLNKKGEKKKGSGGGSPAVAASGSAAAGGGGGASAGEQMADERIGDYRLLNLMMTGQTSQVFEATHVSSGLHFAIKILLPEHANNRETRSFLFHEAEIGLKLQHPNVIRIVSLSKDKVHPHFVMEFFPGGSLKMRIMHKEKDFIKEKAHGIVLQAATALAFINAKGFVHRDVKPDNILVNASGDVRIIDFAITQPISSGLGSMFMGKGPVQGTRSYMSPEQIRNEALDGRADIYSFGATCYEMVTGRPPYRAVSPQELLNKHLYEKPVTPRVHNPEVSEEFAELVMKMIAKKKEDRFANFHEILMELKKIKVFAVKKGTAK